MDNYLNIGLYRIVQLKLTLLKLNDSKKKKIFFLPKFIDSTTTTAMIKGKEKEKSHSFIVLLQIH